MVRLFPTAASFLYHIGVAAQLDLADVCVTHWVRAVSRWPLTLLPGRLLVPLPGVEELSDSFGGCELLVF